MRNHQGRARRGRRHVVVGDKDIFVHRDSIECGLAARQAEVSSRDVQEMRGIECGRLLRDTGYRHG